MKDRIYICHTYYHAYVTFLKELKIRAEADPARKAGTATLVLSKMSNNFENLKARVESTGLFEEVLEFDEKREDFFPELAKYRLDTGNFLGNLKNRIRFTREYARLEAPYVPVNLKEYKDIYVYCDSDPIGYYLNQNHIRYHAVEDGLNCLKNFDAARYDNRGHFKLKAFLSRYLNLIFVQNGYGKYCMDMEVNSIEALDHPISKMIEVPREKLVEGLDGEGRDILIRLFIENRQELEDALRKAGEDHRPVSLILTEPLCRDLQMRRKLFSDMIREYAGDGVVVIKPHPRDVLNYREIFPEHIVLDGAFPMEILNFVCAQMEMEFERVVTVYTVPSSIHCAGKKLYLGDEFMDRYEEPSLHRDAGSHSEQKLK